MIKKLLTLTLVGSLIFLCCCNTKQELYHEEKTELTKQEQKSDGYTVLSKQHIASEDIEAIHELHDVLLPALADEDEALLSDISTDSFMKHVESGYARISKLMKESIDIGLESKEAYLVTFDTPTIMPKFIHIDEAGFQLPIPENIKEAYIDLHMLTRGINASLLCVIYTKTEGHWKVSELSISSYIANHMTIHDMFSLMTENRDNECELTAILYSHMIIAMLTNSSLVWDGQEDIMMEVIPLAGKSLPFSDETFVFEEEIEVKTRGIKLDSYDNIFALTLSCTTSGDLSNIDKLKEYGSYAKEWLYKNYPELEKNFANLLMRFYAEDMNPDSMVTLLMQGEGADVGY